MYYYPFTTCTFITLYYHPVVLSRIYALLASQ
jgi:hypothetical protein